MNSKEIVEGFIQKRTEKFKKFIISQVVLDIIEIAILVFALLKLMDTEYGVYAVIGIGAVVIFLTILINIKSQFGSLQNFANIGQISNLYNQEKEKFEKVQKEHKLGKVDESALLEAQKSFEQSVEQIAEKIKAQEKN